MDTTTRSFTVADTASSISRQHFIDTGMYLAWPHGGCASPLEYARTVMSAPRLAEGPHFAAGWLVGVEGAAEITGNPMPLQVDAAKEWLGGLAAGRYAAENGWATPTERELDWPKPTTRTLRWPDADTALGSNVPGDPVAAIAAEVPEQGSTTVTLTRADGDLLVVFEDGRTLAITVTE